MRREVLFTLILMFFILNVKTVSAESTVSVTTNTVYKITGETVNGIPRYIVDLEKIGAQHGEKNMTILGENFASGSALRRMFFGNSTGNLYYTYLKEAGSEIIEQGPGRVHIRYENTSSSYGNSANCWISPEAVCWNYTADYYFYPRYYLVKYYIWGNWSRLMFEDGWYMPYPIPVVAVNVYRFDTSASYYNNGTYYQANFTTDTCYKEFDKSIAFAYNTSGHNKTYMTFSLALHNFTYVPVWCSRYINDAWSSLRFYSGMATTTPKGSLYFSYGLLFSDSGNRSLEENYTVWLGFKDQWFDIYYPASISTITGSYLGRDNITGTYNFTASSNRVDFNYSTGNYTRTYPVFHIKDLSNVTAIKDHVWLKNYTAGSTWTKLINYTDFIIQEGNSTYFGYNYILLMLNYTLYNSSQTYEIWISNTTDPDIIPPQYCCNSTDSTIAGKPVEFRLKWNDNVGLSGYIFSFDNCTGSFTNDTWLSFEGNEFPAGESSEYVSVNVSDVYKITGETVNGIPRYIVDIERTETAVQGEVRNITIFSQAFPYYSSTSRGFYIWNSTGSVGTVSVSTKANVQLIEQGPDRIYIHAENSSSSYGSVSDCWLSPEAVCWNISVDIYAYPRYYIQIRKVWGNFSKIQFFVGGPGWQVPYTFAKLGGAPSFGAVAWYFRNGSYYDSNNTWGVTIKHDNYMQYVSFLFNETGHNKTYALIPMYSELSGNPQSSWNVNNNPVYYIVGLGFNGGQNPSPYTFGYGLLFSESGNKSLAENETVWLGFRDQWFDIYYPASITPITGSYLGRDNITGTYNFTASNNKLNFNFSTDNYTRFYPLFQVKNLDFSAVNHIWYRNVTSNQGKWQKLKNGTNFLIQEGNSTYFGYNYIIILMNATFSPNTKHEFWISNDSDPTITEAWSNVTKIINSTVGCTIRWKVYANDTNNNWNESEIFYLTTTSEDTIPPTYCCNSTNSTLAGTTVSHNLFWQDNVNLTYAIFSFDNCTGSFQNISEMSLSGNSAWSNFTIVINSTVDCKIRWKVYANDSSNNWNVSEIFSYITTSIPSPSLPPPAGGGGGIALPPITVNTTPGKVIIFIPLIQPTAKANVSIQKTEGIDFTQIAISVKNKVASVQINITKLDAKPEETPALVNVYRYIRIDKKNIEDENVSEVKIVFKVEKSWIASNNINPDTIALYRYTTKWEKLNTVKKGADSEYLYYEATSPGLSYFAISGEKSIQSCPFECCINEPEYYDKPCPSGYKCENHSCVAIITPCTEDWICTEWSECIGGKQTRICKDRNECGTTKNKPEEERSCEVEKPTFAFWLGIVLVAILIVIVLIYIVKRKKKVEEKTETGLQK